MHRAVGQGCCYQAHGNHYPRFGTAFPEQNGNCRNNRTEPDFKIGYSLEKEIQSRIGESDIEEFQDSEIERQNRSIEMTMTLPYKANLTIGAIGEFISE